MKYIYSINQKFVEYKYRNEVDCGYIFMFHQINDDKNKWLDPNVSITTESFEAFINKLKLNGYRFLDISKVGISNNPKSVYLTFDDIFSDFYKNAMPVLEKKGIPYCCFVAIGLLNKDQYATKEMLMDLSSKELCTLGAHTISHPNLRKKNSDSAYEEIHNSKFTLEQMLCKPVNYFAYPYGSKQACSKRDIAFSQKAGYVMAFSTYSMGLNKKYVESNKWFIPRINVNENNYRMADYV